MHFACMMKFTLGGFFGGSSGLIAKGETEGSCPSKAIFPSKILC